MEDLKKEHEYAMKILGAIQDILENEDSENYIGINELTDGDNLKHFLHALATIAPCHIFNTLTSSEKTQLEFNHVANQLCFEYSKLQ
jgi:hypothetical protein